MQDGLLGRLANTAVVIAVAVMLGAAPGLADAQKSSSPGGAARTITWEELVPKDWDPTKGFRDRDPSQIREGSAQEQDLMRALRDAWDNAPTRQELAGARVRLPGYVVPLDMAQGKVKEFLLVPYFGACIHTPPPPANQIVHVTLKEPATLRTMDAVWASGTFSTRRQDSPMGVSGYSMAAELVEPYRETPR